MQVILVDLVLGLWQSGEAIARRARSLYPDIPYAYISGYGGEAIAGVEEQDVEARLLRKPFDAAELLGMIDDHLASASPT